jgi:hypothetical protein
LLLSGHGLSLPELPGVRQRGRLGVDVSEEEGYATASRLLKNSAACANEA